MKSPASPLVALGTLCALLVFGAGMFLTLATAAPVGPGIEGVKDEREIARLQRMIDGAMDDRRATDEQIGNALDALAEYQTVGVAEFLITDVLDAIGSRRARVDRIGIVPHLLRALATVGAGSSEAQAYIDEALSERMFNDEVPIAVRQPIVESKLEGSTEEFLARALEASEWEILTVVLLFIEEDRPLLDSQAAFDGVKRSLFHPEARVRRAALRVMMQQTANSPSRSERKIAGYEALIDLLSREQSGLRDQVIEGLQQLSGQAEINDNVSTWRMWLNAYKEGRQAEIDEADRGSATIPRDYFNIELPRKVIFVLDVSSSMEEELEDKDEIRAQLDPDGQRYEWGQINTKIDFAKAELFRAIRAFKDPDTIQRERDRGRDRDRRRRGDDDDEGSVVVGPDGPPLGDQESAFTIIAYNTTMSAWNPRLQRATQRNKESAAQWVNGQATGALTNIFGALEWALDIASGIDPEAEGAVASGGIEPEDSVEAIFFLTDGYATTGKYCGDQNRAFGEVDTDGSGGITQDEFMNRFPEEFRPQRVVEQAFSRIDENGDSILTRQEFTGTQFRWYYGAQMATMMNEVKERNRLLQVKIHTIGIGQHDTLTLENLAEQNRGEYVNLGPQ